MGKCAVPGCQRKEAGFFMAYQDKGGKRFGYVCGTHDRLYGRQNLMRAGLTLQQAIKFEGQRAYKKAFDEKTP